MCVISGTVAGLTAIGSAIATGASAVASGAAAVGSAIGTGLSAAGGAIASGASAAWGGLTSAYTATTGLLSEAFAVGAASEAGATGLAVDGALVGSTEAVALNAGAEVSMLTSMLEAGVPMTAENVALATKGANAMAAGDVTAKVAAATAGTGGIGGSLKLLGGVVQAAGGGAEAVGAYQQGKADAANLKAQAKDEELRAQQEIEAAEIEAKDLARRQRQTVGRGKVAAAANGVMLETRAESAPSVWEQDMAAELAWDREKLFHNAQQRANIRRYNASQLRVGAKNARRGGNLKAATAAIKGTAGLLTSMYS